ncbi:MAG TPA: threonine-phosphate decarboxylase CobD [bacterium]|nr:threonine-phosphate decarboxylase CobD [bacterium]
MVELERRLGRPLADFSANISPLGTSAAARRAAMAMMGLIRHYPDPFSSELKQKIARRLRVREENVLVGNGSIELIYLIMHAFLPKSVLLPVPTFSEYERAARAVGASARYIQLKEDDGFALTCRGSLRADMVFLCNPNNPTGNLLAASRRLPAWRCGLTVVDEAFIDFLPDEKEHTFVNEAAGDRGLVVVRSFTKFFALPGLRLGCIIGHTDTIRRLAAHQHPWSVNALAQAAGEAVIDDDEYREMAVAAVEKERSYLFRALSRIDGIRPFPSAANFILVKIERKGITAERLRDRLLRAGILIRDCGNFRGLDNRYFRVAVRTRRENRALICELKGFGLK